MRTTIPTSRIPTMNNGSKRSTRMSSAIIYGISPDILTGLKKRGVLVMARRPPLNRKQFAIATGFFYNTDTGKRLVRMLPRAMEPDTSYLHRVNRLKAPSKLDDMADAEMPFFMDKDEREKRAVGETEADIQRNL